MKIIDAHRHYESFDEIAQKRKLWDSMGYQYLCYSGNLNGIKELKKCYPSYIIGFAYLKMDNGPFYWRNQDIKDQNPITLEDINRYRDEGFKGLKVIYTEKPYSHDDYLPYYERAEKLDMPILFHTGWVDNGWEHCKPHQENYHPIYLQTIAGFFPKLKIICAHFGGVQFSYEALLGMWKHPNIYSDLSGETMRRMPSLFLQNLFNLLSIDNISNPPELDMTIFQKFVYGSDNSDSMLSVYQKIFTDLKIPEEVQECIFYKNMAKMLDLKI
jgi:predicted TIM-barrel fold metal-dependent hydrolase